MDYFFDSHTHLTLKNQFSKNGNTTTPWKAITENDLKDGLNDLIQLFALGLVDKMFSSQSSADMLIESNYKLVVMPLFAPDLGLVKAIESKKAFMKILRKNQKGRFGEVLNYERYGVLVSLLDAFSIVKNDISLLVKNDPFQPGRKVVFLNSKNQWDENQVNTLHVVCSVEGIHSLRSDLDNKDPELILADIEKNLTYVHEQGIKIIMANLTHIDGMNKLFCNQAYAMDGMRVNGFDEKELRPKDRGLTDDGKKLVDFLEKEEICTDIKHMSPMARFDLYRYRKNQDLKSPIVSSHSGLCGIPFKSDAECFSDYIYSSRKDGESYRLKVGKPVKYKFEDFPSPGFNASSINLFDEDVRAIYDSDGILGISLDERVLGYTKAWKNNDDTYSPNVAEVRLPFGEFLPILTDTDFLSIPEYHELELTHSTKQKHLTQCVNAEKFIQFSKDFHYKVPELQFYHFLNHLLHCVKLGKEFDGVKGVEKMLTQIVCVGSDFDGLIEPLDISVNCRKMSGLKARFIRDFEKAVIDNQLFLPQNWSIERIADRIFFENGRDFILKRLK